MVCGRGDGRFGNGGSKMMMKDVTELGGVAWDGLYNLCCSSDCTPVTLFVLIYDGKMDPMKKDASEPCLYLVAYMFW